MTRQIFAAEINFEDTPLQIRERFNSSEKNVQRLLVSFKRRVPEVFIMANRQRFTVYIVNDTLNPLTEFFHEENYLKGYVQFYYNSGESVTHLMATASGLLSPVKGEGRILSEMIQCYDWAVACGCIGMTLDNSLTKAFEIGKKVRTETAIDKFCSSVVEAGIELLYNRLENLHTKNVLVIGTGKMARLALECLTREGILNIAITGHDDTRANKLAKKFGVKAINLDRLGKFFSEADIIIAGSHQEIDRELLPERKEPDSEYKGRIILDLGIPPNFDLRTLEMWAEEFYNLDDLRRLQPSPLEGFGGIEAAWRMVMKASGDFVVLLQLLNHSPVLTAYLSRQFNLKNAEMKVKPKRTLRSMLLFKKAENLTDTASVKDFVNARVHINNHVAENGRDVVRHVQGMKKFKFFLSEN
jgi:glutamyl-tRNA reductase